MESHTIITVSPENGRHFVKRKIHCDTDLQVIEYSNHLLAYPKFGPSDIPHLAWVCTEGIKTVIQVTYFGGTIVRPYSSDDFYFKHLREFHKLRRHRDVTEIRDLVKLLKKYGESET